MCLAGEGSEYKTIWTDVVGEESRFPKVLDFFENHHHHEVLCCRFGFVCGAG